MPRLIVEAGTVESERRAPWGTALFDTPEPEALGVQLKGMFDQLSEGPMPSRLVDLADALEAAFQRGDLYAACAKSKPARR